MNLLHRVGLTAALLVCAGTALAHHSTAMFDMAKTVEYDGVVKEFQWTNPHTYTIVTVDGKNAGDYGLEGMSPNYLVRNGWTKHTLKPGDKVKVQVNPLKDGRKGGFMVSVTKASDGKLLYNLPHRETPAEAAKAVQSGGK
jgi:uncharacterized protein DUF6152